MLDRDSLYTTAWLGLMAFVWFGWSQESPNPRLRRPLIVGSVIGLIVAIGFGVLTALSWDGPTALEGRYGQFGTIVAIEVGLAGLGAAILSSTGRGHWSAWWVAVVVAAHFVSLAWILGGPSLAVLGGIELAALAVVAHRLKGSSAPSSRSAGPVMGLSLLLYAVGSGIWILA